jgi:hypothetical protein
VASKDVTREQAELKKSQAAEFMNRIGQPDRADEFENMTVDEYADHKGLRLTNRSTKSTQRTKTKWRLPNMPNTTKTDLQSQLDQINDILSDAYDPESSRADLAAAIGQALDTINADDDDDNDSDNGSDDSDDDNDADDDDDQDDDAQD